MLASYNEARISPARDATQMVLDHRVDVRPSVPVMHYVDYWGTEVSAFDVHEPHDRLIVAARSLVETVAAVPDATDADWEVLSDENVRDRSTNTSTVAARSARLTVSRGRGRSDRRRAARPRETVEAVSAWVRESLTYEPGATDVSTNARSALELGRGVCQDFVHVALALLRAAGIPARYASGYLHPDADAAVDAAVTGQSHAWLEAWTGSWQRIDPTNGSDVGERTCSSRAAATTATSRRSKACTTARRRVRATYA